MGAHLDLGQVHRAESPLGSQPEVDNGFEVQLDHAGALNTSAASGDHIELKAEGRPLSGQASETTITHPAMTTTMIIICLKMHEKAGLLMSSGFQRLPQALSITEEVKNCQLGYSPAKPHRRSRRPPNNPVDTPQLSTPSPTARFKS
jgi:hypothetical protein